MAKWTWTPPRPPLEADLRAPEADPGAVAGHHPDRLAVGPAVHDRAGRARPRRTPRRPRGRPPRGRVRSHRSPGCPSVHSARPRVAASVGRHGPRRDPGRGERRSAALVARDADAAARAAPSRPALDDATAATCATATRYVAGNTEGDLVWRAQRLAEHGRRRPPATPRSSPRVVHDEYERAGEPGAHSMRLTLVWVREDGIVARARRPGRAGKLTPRRHGPLARTAAGALAIGALAAALAVAASRPRRARGRRGRRARVVRVVDGDTIKVRTATGPTRRCGWSGSTRRRASARRPRSSAAPSSAAAALDARLLTGKRVTAARDPDAGRRSTGTGGRSPTSIVGGRDAGETMVRAGLGDAVRLRRRAVRARQARYRQAESAAREAARAACTAPARATFTAPLTAAHLLYRSPDGNGSPGPRAVQRRSHAGSTTREAFAAAPREHDVAKRRPARNAKRRIAARTLRRLAASTADAGLDLERARARRSAAALEPRRQRPQRAQPAAEPEALRQRAAQRAPARRAAAAAATSA